MVKKNAVKTKEEILAMTKGEFEKHVAILPFVANDGNCWFCVGSSHCFNSMLLLGCSDCSDCCACINGERLRYAVFNVKLSKKEYKRKMREWFPYRNERSRDGRR